MAEEEVTATTTYILFFGKERLRARSLSLYLDGSGRRMIADMGKFSTRRNRASRDSWLGDFHGTLAYSIARARCRERVAARLGVARAP